MGQICTFFKIFFSFFCVLRAITAVRAHCPPPPRQIGLKQIRFFSLVIRLLVKSTVDSRLFEPALIRIIRLFELRSRSPWICLPNSGKNTLGYSNFSYSNFQLFEAISIPLGTNYSLNHPQLFEFFLFGDRRVRPLIFCD